MVILMKILLKFWLNNGQIWVRVCMGILSMKLWGLWLVGLIRFWGWLRRLRIGRSLGSNITIIGILQVNSVLVRKSLRRRQNSSWKSYPSTKPLKTSIISSQPHGPSTQNSTYKSTVWVKTYLSKLSKLIKFGILTIRGNRCMLLWTVYWNILLIILWSS